MIHVQQGDDFTCGVAAAAMVAGVSFKTARRHCHHEITSGLSSRQLGQLLRNLGVRYKRLLLPELRRTVPHIVSVPSLNVPGGMHYAVFVFEGRWLLLDPQRGRKGKRFYSMSYDDPEGVPLRGYAELIRILS